MNRYSLRDLKKAATAHALANAAFELALERGLDGFVVDDVAQRAGYSRRTFANHYSCKEEAVVMGAVTSNGNNDAEHVLEELPEGSAPMDALRLLISTQFTIELLRKLREVQVLAKQHSTLEPYLLNVFRSLQTAALETLNDLYKDRYPEEYKHLLVGAVYGAILPVIDGSINVLLPGQSAGDTPGAAAFEQYLSTVFGYLRSGL
ncbi:TetR/AcrR family transcriptional regulator [Cohnella lubricantis]|uniref:TetR family transcriptional regulator n=1 Tax=Cohnella lubricantis TaxID=2163172 RepID=A0A841TH77_9BACL|nr:TetR/AcrR family transcriptional regulator [Cohnella lubricantis]MBB6679756.1 TetR family transcriptional regulator [Cohnella lubricantis]MBP2119451.1 AcrR family transcriptional regulator [Cohnella lubricantis]